jgi:hypothetical protein
MGNKFKKVPTDIPVSELSPFNISCGSTKCEDGLHCFQFSQRVIKKFGENGVCKECGIKLINWERVHKNDIKDSKFIFQSMKNELIRHVYWHIKIKDEDLTKAVLKGKSRIKDEAINRLKNVIGIEKPYRGGFTPYYGNIIYYAQHATATCCRKCLEYWHGIEVDKVLSEKEIEFCTQLIMCYIDDKIPQLKD